MFGLILSVVADVVSPCGVALQKIGHQRSVDQKYWRSPVWWTGLAMMVGAEIGNGIAYGDEQIATSAITAVGCVGILVNAIISRVFLKEELTWCNIAGASLVVIGVLQVIAFSPRSEDPIDVWSSRGTPMRPLGIATIAVLAVGFAGSLAIAVLRGSARRRGGVFVFWLITSALAGGLGVISARYAFMLVVDSVSETGSSQMWQDWAFYLAWAGIVACGVAQLYTFNRALSLADTRVVVPVFYVLFTLVASTSSSIVYNEFTKGSLVEWVLFINSFMVCIAGIVLLLIKGEGGTSVEEVVRERPLEVEVETSTTTELTGV